MKFLKSVDGLEIKDDLANQNIKNSVIIIFDSNSSNFLRIISENQKKEDQNISFYSKVISI